MESRGMRQGFAERFIKRPQQSRVGFQVLRVFSCILGLPLPEEQQQIANARVMMSSSKWLTLE